MPSRAEQPSAWSMGTLLPLVGVDFWFVCLPISKFDAGEIGIKIGWINSDKDKSSFFIIAFVIWTPKIFDIVVKFRTLGLKDGSWTRC